ncbi:hypothetical protein HCH_04496 [Hahella chejuensis KCTC 2396]|uniref:Uncharacterized protein n=1 Tax=Hahella chejuensis (strain KCTC 2396) TaxID=349521 RepID=Q2SDS6_HAHCH|nr:hypothetical protein HCH_04496 [Hahella chejuensis KCTC 2396]
MLLGLIDQGVIVFINIFLPPPIQRYSGATVVKRLFLQAKQFDFPYLRRDFK